MLTRHFRTILTSPASRCLATSTSPETSRSFENDVTATRIVDMKRELWRKPNSPFIKTPQAWVSSLENVEDERLGIVDLHPDVFRVTPRLDILHRNITWQMVYRNVQMTKMLTKAEMPGGGKKPSSAVVSPMAPVGPELGSTCCQTRSGFRAFVSH
ncbi:unnamed protein product [Caenorhabditis auriculariae]|uniref:Large ribosomal subunit protein uL4m n=1 Tax=Caenorhabditis auriculariae TaxID=2777116 RepID=A0A8S1I0B0_9PELO|nr:unnamed protein product [Caenorhabditis auriculariae]